MYILKLVETMEHSLRGDISSDCHDQQSCEIFASCVNLYRSLQFKHFFVYKFWPENPAKWFFEKYHNLWVKCNLTKSKGIDCLSQISILEFHWWWMYCKLFSVCIRLNFAQSLFIFSANALPSTLLLWGYHGMCWPCLMLKIRTTDWHVGGILPSWIHITSH